MAIPALALVACSTATLSKGEFGVQVPPTPTGAGKFLETGTDHSLSAGMARKVWTVKLKPIENSGGNGLQSDSLNATYNMDTWGYGEFDVFSTSESRSSLYVALGLMPYPYMTFSIGKNYRHFEFFVHGMFSYMWERSTYSGEGALFIKNGFTSWYENGALTNSTSRMGHGNFGVSYNFYDKFLFRLGMDVIVGDFEGRYFSPHTDIAWFW